MMWTTFYLDDQDFQNIQLFQDKGLEAPLTPNKNVCTEENSWINEYLDQEIFQDQHEIEPIQKTSTAQTLDIAPELSQQAHSATLERETSIVEANKRSIFHNIQKNLITFLRKINIRWKDLVHEPSGLRAYDLWKLFLTGKVFTKQCLYMVYGVAQHQNQEYMQKLANSNPQLKKILAKYPFEEIQNAQALLRKKTYQELSNMPQATMKKLCKMNNFDHFLTFLQTFMEELQQPGLTLRMKRIQKKKMQMEVSSSRDQTPQQ